MFSGTPYETSLGEDTPVETTVFRAIEATDRDLVGDVLEVGCANHEQDEQVNIFSKNVGYLVILKGNCVLAGGSLLLLLHRSPPRRDRPRHVQGIRSAGEAARL